MGGVGTGFGGTAPHGPGSPLPWLAVIGAGAVLTLAAASAAPHRAASADHPALTVLIRRPAAIAFAVGLMVITAGAVGLLLAGDHGGGADRHKDGDPHAAATRVGLGLNAGDDLWVSWARTGHTRNGGGHG